MHEVLEGPEAREEWPLTLPVTVTLAILAVFVALVTLLGHRAHTEELLLQTRATDQWALFQAKNIRLHEMQSVADMFATFTVVDKDKAATLRESYLQQTNRYAKEKDEAGQEAKKLEVERDLVARRADRFDAGEVFLEIGLIICSLTLLTRRKSFWFSGIAVGAVGLLVALTGFLLR